MEGHKQLGDYRKRFDSWFPTTKDKDGKTLGSRWRAYIPVGDNVVASNKSKIAPKDIASALEKEGWKVEDYTKGMAVKVGGDSKEVNSEEWNPKKPYPVGSFVKHGGKTFKAIKNTAIGSEPIVGNREWLDFDKIAKGTPKKIEKSIGSIFVDLANKAKNAGKTAEEALYLNLERKNKKFQQVEAPKGESGAKEYVVISRHPYDVMGASADRGWYSCQNVGVGQDDYTTTKQRGTAKEWDKSKPYTNGSLVMHNDKVYQANGAVEAGLEPSSKSTKWEESDNFKGSTVKDKVTGKLNKVPTRKFDSKDDKGMCVITRKGAYYLGIGGDVRFGTMIAYLVNADDKNINNPIARLLIKPYVKPDTGQVQMFASDNQYGAKTGSHIEQNKDFARIVNDWLEEHQSGEGVFKITFASSGDLSSNANFDDHKFHGHYNDNDPSERTADTNYKNNNKNVKEFKDGLTWDEIINQHRWFAKNEFSNVVIGEDYGTLVLYSGEITKGVWQDGDIQGGTLSSINVNKGNIKNATLEDCDLGVVKLDNCKLENCSIKIRNTFKNKCEIVDCESTGSIDASDSSFKNMKFKDAPGDNKISITLKKCKIQGETEFSGNIKKEEIKISDCEYSNYRQTGGAFSGILHSGNLHGVHINKIITKGLPKLNNCIIEHGIINDGVLKNCIFKAGVFKKGRWFGGNFEGGTFAGGHFILGKFGPDAIWKGGVWHDGEGKPTNAKGEEENSSKKDISKKLKELNLKKRLEDKNPK
jgi:uncharacterized protein YjbI with pentapeptide repeats